MACQTRPEANGEFSVLGGSFLSPPHLLMPLERRGELAGLPGLPRQRSAVAESARIAGHKPPQYCKISTSVRGRR